MDTHKKTINFSYRIEPKPGGGFIAHTSDPTMPTAEAATKEELEQMMQAKVNAMLGGFSGLDLKELLRGDTAASKTTSEVSYQVEENPALEGATKEEILRNLPAESRTLSGDLHSLGLKKLFAEVVYRIEENPGGGFRAVPNDPGGETIEAATKAELMQKMREKLTALIGNEIPRDLLSKLGGMKLGDIKVLNVEKDVHVSGQPSFGNAFQKASQPGLLQPTPPQDSNSMGPILPGEQSTGGIGKILLFVLALTAIVALIYYALHR